MRNGVKVQATMSWVMMEEKERTIKVGSFFTSKRREDGWMLEKESEAQCSAAQQETRRKTGTDQA